MEISDFARQVLFEENLEAKLLDPGSLSDHAPGTGIPVPSAPGRHKSMRFPALGERIRAPLPSVRDLEKTHERGVLLHFFANHELLALELMALTLLRFPDAPHKFRRGIAGTMLEEQRHLRLYLGRMQEFGLDFGHIPVNRYFWDIMAETPSPLTFVTQMSLTLEQANLDFSKYYMDLFATLGDDTTRDILETVYQDEIGHVRHGLHWFREWRSPESSDWEAYKKLLPFPLTPARAKGTFYYTEPRRQAGLTEDFIRELYIYHYSKGRPPRVFWFQPEFEEEISLGQKDFIPGKALKTIKHDLAILMLFLTTQDDVVIVPERPTTEFLMQLKEAGFDGCQVALDIRELDGRLVRSFEPWGKSPSAMRLAQSSTATLMEQHPEGSPSLWESKPGQPQISSKIWAKQLAQKHLPHMTPGRVADSLDEVMRLLTTYDAASTVLIKAPYGTAGRNAIRLRADSTPSTQQLGWLRKILATQKAVVVEPLLDKVADFSMQISVGSDEKECVGLTRFMTNARGQYIGHILGRKLDGLPADVVRAYHEQNIPEQMQRAGQLVATELAQAGYRGPAGIDALMYRDATGVHLYPIVEVNTRYTMGRIALALDRRIHASVPAQWRHLALTEIQRQGHASFATFAETISQGVPLTQKNHCLMSGIVFTNDPKTAQGVLSILFVGEEAVRRAQAL
jgi:uncharacterized ferritin-like protein (DUF455 family)